VLGRSLDELAPQTRRVLGLIAAYVAEQMQAQSLARPEVRFTRRELRQHCAMSDAAIRVHLERLVAMEYVRPVAGRNGLKFEYELAFDGDLDRSAPQMIGLIDVEALRAAHAGHAGSVGTMATSQGEDADLARRLQAACTGLVPGLQGDVLATHPCENRLGSLAAPVDREDAHHRAEPVNGRSRSAVAPSARASSSSLAAKTVALG